MTPDDHQTASVAGHVRVVRTSSAGGDPTSIEMTEILCPFASYPGFGIVEISKSTSALPRFYVFVIPPDSKVLPRLPELRAINDGGPFSLDQNSFAMHQNPTLDYLVVLRGAVSLRLKDGTETELGPGDCIVQDGCEHAWRNHSSEDCVMACMLVPRPEP
jgi:mannose-6-phosphate isomerase-like protein (cupin superfamily)